MTKNNIYKGVNKIMNNETVEQMSKSFNKERKLEFKEAKELVTGAKLEPSNKLPKELSAAICAGCILGYAITFLILILWL